MLTPGGSVTKAKQRTTVQATGIPRPKVKKVPDFAKLHAKQFGKMDDLDSYLVCVHHMFTRILNFLFVIVFSNKQERFFEKNNSYIGSFYSALILK